MRKYFKSMVYPYIILYRSLGNGHWYYYNTSEDNIKSVGDSRISSLMDKNALIEIAEDEFNGEIRRRKAIRRLG